MKYYLRNAGEKGSESIFRDLIVLSGTAGVIGTAVKTAVSGIPFALHLTQSFDVMVAGRIVFHVKDIPMDTGHLLVSLFAHLAFGAFLAVGLGIVYLLSGTDFHLLKGASYGLAAWIVCKCYLVNLTAPGGPQVIDVPTAMVTFTSHMVYGIVTGFLIARYNRFLPRTAGRQ